MKTFSIEEAIKHGWELWKRHKKVLTFSTIIFLVLSLVKSGKNTSSVFQLAHFVLAIIYIIGTIGWIKLLLKIEDGEPTDLHELFRHTDLFWRYLGVAILFGLLVFFGTILFIIPGIYLFLRYQFAPMLVIDKNLSIGQAFKQSAVLTDGVKWKLIGLYLVIILVNIVGFLALGVGLLVSIPVVGLAHIYVYRKLYQAEMGQNMAQNQAPTPSLQPTQG